MRDGSDTLVAAARALADEADRLGFSVPVTHTYNPLTYAREPHEQYLRRFGNGTKALLLVGMNPGPWGMAQTGVPFGDVAWVRDWMGIEAPVGKPPDEHPKRPVEGFSCTRRETSGRRLWAWARDVAGTAPSFFDRTLVVNYCPLLFIEESGRNRTPDRLPAGERRLLFESCDRHLRTVVTACRPQWVVGIGRFAERRIREALGPARETARADAGTLPVIGGIPHPSPASPQANQGWSVLAEEGLRKLGIPIPPETGETS